MALLNIILLSWVGLLSLCGFTVMSLLVGPGQPKVRFMGFLKIDRLLGNDKSKWNTQTQTRILQRPRPNAGQLPTVNRRQKWVSCAMATLGSPRDPQISLRTRSRFKGGDSLVLALPHDTSYVSELE